MVPLKIGILGFRNIAHVHARQVKDCPRARLVSAADLSENMRQVARVEFGLEEVYGHYTDLLKKSDVDAVIIALPVPLHYAATTAALKAGKHVLCEKPPAVNAREAQKMADLAGALGLTLTWGLQRRFLPEMHAARRAIAAGKFGRIYRINVTYTLSRTPVLLSDRFRMHKKGGGVFFDLGVHALDMAWSLLECPKPVRAVAANNTVFPEWNAIEKREDMAEDNSLAMFFFENNAVVRVETCYISQRSSEEVSGHRPKLEILGDKGGLQTPSLTFTTGDPRQANTSVLPVLKSWEKDERLQLLDNFIDAITGKGELLIKPQDGVELMKMIEAVVRSGRRGKEVRL